MRLNAGIVALTALALAGCGGTADTTTSSAPATTTTTVAETTTTTAVTTTLATTTEPPTTSTTSTTLAAAIEIVGDEAFVEHASEALALIDETMPDTYADVRAHILVIKSVTAGSGMVVETKTFQVGDETAYAPGYDKDGQVLWLAATIVHDACHSRLHTEGEPYRGRDAELLCLQDQLTALLTIDRSDRIEDYVQGLIDGVDDPENAYWNDPNRHW